MKFTKFHDRIMKIKKKKYFSHDHENHEFHKIPRHNNGSIENLSISCQNHENFEFFENSTPES